MESELEITLPSDLRSLRIKLVTLERCQGVTGQAASGLANSLISEVVADLDRLLPKVESWTTAIRAERLDRRAAASKASISRILRPVPRRRR